MDSEVGLRPEYQQAVDAASLGWTFWIVWLIPALIVWRINFLFRNNSGGKRLVAFLAALMAGAFACWFLALCHLDYLQSVKHDNAVTEAELTDWSSDTGKALAPLTLIPFAFAYSGIHSASAVATASVSSSLVGSKRIAAEFMQ